LNHLVFSIHLLGLKVAETALNFIHRLVLTMDTSCLRIGPMIRIETKSKPRFVLAGHSLPIRLCMSRLYSPEIGCVSCVVESFYPIHYHIMRRFQQQLILLFHDELWGNLARPHRRPSYRPNHIWHQPSGGPVLLIVVLLDELAMGIEVNEYSRIGHTAPKPFIWDEGGGIVQLRILHRVESSVHRTKPTSAQWWK